MSTKSKINIEYCQCQRVTIEEAERFIRLQCGKPSKDILFAFGLFFDDELIQVAAFGKSDTNRFSWAWLNDCQKFSKRVKDGSKRLFDAFTSSFTVTSCMSKEPHEDCGFVEYDGIYSYFPEGCVYRITDQKTGKFYIGSTIHEQDFLAGLYHGSGTAWREHYQTNLDRKDDFLHEVIADGFASPEEMYLREREEIRKFCIQSENGRGLRIDPDSLCMNSNVSCQGASNRVCPECGCSGARHLGDCSQYQDDFVCEECGGKSGNHKSDCSQFSEHQLCPECGSTGRHRKGCSQYSELTCPDCGASSNNHHKDCPRYVERGHICEECGGKAGAHKKSCSQYVPRGLCSECGGTQGHHKKDCSKYVKRTRTPCPECGTRGRHKDDCSRKNTTRQS